MSMLAIERLTNVKERLFEKGWQKSSYGGPDGPNCVLGSLLFSRIEGTQYYFYTTADKEIEDALKDLTGGDIAGFNDHKDTSFDDIINLIDLAIKTLEMEKNND